MILNGSKNIESHFLCIRMKSNKIIKRRGLLTQDWIISHPVLKRAQKTNLIEFYLPFV